jgi:hypothetical protein
MFSLALSDETRPADADAIVADLAVAILGYTGYDADAVAHMMAELRAALTQGAASRHPRCTVEFLAHDGVMEIAIYGTGGDEWRTERPLP